MLNFIPAPYNLIVKILGPILIVGFAWYMFSTHYYDKGVSAVEQKYEKQRQLDAAEAFEKGVKSVKATTIVVEKVVEKVVKQEKLRYVYKERIDVEVDASIIIPGSTLRLFNDQIRESNGHAGNSTDSDGSTKATN